MGDRGFNVGFVVIFLIVLAVLFYFFKFSDIDPVKLRAFWAALIVLFLLFGIIVVSLYANHARGKKR